MTSAGPIILTGFQRSGTTALGLALDAAFDASGDLFAVNGKLLYYLERWVTDADIVARHLRADEIVHALKRRPPLGLRAPEYLARCESALREFAAQLSETEDPPPAAEVRRTIVADAHRGLERWGDKYNEYMLHAGSLQQMAPGVRTVLMYRHPAQVADSMLRWTGDRPWRPVTADGCQRKWMAWNDAWLQAVSDDQDRHLVVRYDHVCLSAATRRRVADFVGIDERFLRSLTLTDREERRPIPSSCRRTWQQLEDRAR